MSVKSIENGSLTLSNLSVSTINGLPPSGVTSVYTDNLRQLGIISTSGTYYPIYNMSLESGTYLFTSSWGISNSGDNTISFDTISYGLNLNNIIQQFSNYSLLTNNTDMFVVSGIFILTSTTIFSSSASWTGLTGYDPQAEPIINIYSTNIVKLF